MLRFLKRPRKRSRLDAHPISRQSNSRRGGGSAASITASCARTPDINQGVWLQSSLARLQGTFRFFNFASSSYIWRINKAELRGAIARSFESIGDDSVRLARRARAGRRRWENSFPRARAADRRGGSRGRARRKAYPFTFPFRLKGSDVKPSTLAEYGSRVVRSRRPRHDNNAATNDLTCFSRH
ncbi:hypothetical protein EVAR_21435_1 [Eumeta japonica]|uniref:Uncharacterized protein n=1 Tax=Eumeta variegata TaxID=151549 RepID=A0A4C1VH09_EUMVA|nr:hypothetical protein EVAR_21435_1 [Eumeta japonica]